MLLLRFHRLTARMASFVTAAFSKNLNLISLWSFFNEYELVLSTSSLPFISSLSKSIQLFSMLVFHQFASILEVILITVLQCYQQIIRINWFHLNLPHQVQALLKIMKLRLGDQHTDRNPDGHIFHIFLNKSSITFIRVECDHPSHSNVLLKSGNQYF